MGRPANSGFLAILHIILKTSKEVSHFSLDCFLKPFALSVDLHFVGPVLAKSFPIIGIAFF